MSQETIKQPSDADGSFQFETSAYPVVTFSAALVNTDTVTVSVYLPDGNAAVAAADVNGAVTGLDASNPSRVYVGGPTYVLDCTTSQDTGIYADLGSRRV